MAIFGDVNDNRVIPLILMSGMIFLTGLYLFHLYKWLRSLVQRKFSRKLSEEQVDVDEEGYVMGPRHDMERKQSTISAWDMEGTIFFYQPTIKTLPEEETEDD